MRRTRGSVLIALAALAGFVAVPGAAHAAPRASGPSGATCIVQGSATFSPHLTVKPKTVGYSFSGTLSHCFGRTPSGVIDKNASGKVSASGSGTLSCEGGVSKGAGSASVGGNLSSSFSFMTESAGAAVTVESPPGTSGVIGELVFQT